MPKAKNLKQAYNNFSQLPLRTEEEFREFYVERTTHTEEMRDAIEIANEPQKFLFMGFRGRGKSTELNRLSMMLKNYIVVNYSIAQDLDTSDFDYRDFFISLALEVYNVANEKGLQIHEDIKKDFEDFAKNVTKIKEEEIEKDREYGLSFPKIILLKIGRERKTREYVRKELQEKITDLIQKLNNLIIEIETMTEKKIVVIVDDLDNLPRYEQAENFFYKNYHLLLQPKCHVIYTFPIPLAFNPFFENVRDKFSNSFLLPQPPVKNKDGSIYEKGYNFYKKIITNRIQENLIEREAIDEAIQNTGKLKELIAVMRDASLRAYRKEKSQIGIEEVRESIEKLRRFYDRSLTEEHKKKLLEIYENKEGRSKDTKDRITRELLFSLIAVEYENEEERWCDVNPILLPLVEKWKRS